MFRFVLILSSASSLLGLFILPSSKNKLGKMQGGLGRGLLTADVTDAFRLQERFEQIQHTRKLGKDNRLLHTFRPFLNITEQLHNFSCLR